MSDLAGRPGRPDWPSATLLDGRVTTLLVDTGSAVTLVREDLWRDAKSGGAVQWRI